MARILTTYPKWIRLVGEFDLESLPQLQAGLEQAWSGAGPAVIELDGVTFLDIVSLAAILRAAQERAGRGRVILRHPTKEVARLLDVIFDRLDLSSFNVEVRRGNGDPRAAEWRGRKLGDLTRRRRPPWADRGTGRGSLPRH
jgi:anti-anti-sigma factor